ncbi:glycoside hydrolase family 26 protein [Actinoplanes sp. TFC3]|uniref:glycoside hydrolase family 26 protein n=1 Tax=Actinoplanes sp. TFC3 TaxID=1710355 RepID=UPI0009E99E4B|nr:glycosyl hydrolase [Actinoplanes sp. TFC3]
MNTQPERKPTRSPRLVRSVAVGLLVVAGAAVAATQADSFAATTAPSASGRAIPTPKTSGPAAPTAVSSVALVPAQGALLGHYYGNGTVTKTDQRIGRKPAVHLTYYDFKDDWVKSPVNTSDFADGRVPLINVEPNNINFTDITNGRYDTMLKKRADDAKALGKKFFVDFAAEMNGDEGWGGHDPAKYIAAWRHIHDIFTARGATNVVWAWCPNNEDSGDSPAAMKYYPGDQYVDWTGIDGYNWGTSDPDFEWQSFRSVFSRLYPQLAAKGKPIIIAEMASDEAGGSKASWITEVVPTLKTTYPLIKAIVWFDVDKERHWQINSSASALTAYQKMAKDPYLNP